MSISDCCFLTRIQISQETGKLFCYSHLFQNAPQFVVIHTVKGFIIVNEPQVGAFLKFCCFFYDPTNAGNLISGSSAFFKSSLNIWNFSVHVLLKPSLENFEHNLAGMWNECNCAKHSLALPIFEIGMKTDLFQSCGHCWVFQICWHIEYSTLTASSFRISNGSAVIESACIAGDLGLIPGLGRFPGERNCYPL